MPPATSWDVVAISTLTGLLSILLFHVVEVPARRLRPPRRYLKIQTGVVGLALILVVALPPLQRRLFSETELQISDAWFDRAPYRCGKLARIVEPVPASCTLTKSTPEALTFLLVGDSHADAIKYAMSLAASEAGVGLRLMKDNYALGNGDVSVASVAAEAEERGVTTVVLHSAATAQKGEDVAELVRAGEIKGFRVILIEPVPFWPVHVPLALHRAQRAGPPLPVMTSGGYKNQNEEFFRAIDRIESPIFERYQTVEYFCDPTCKAASPSGSLYYFDNSHLTKTGSHRLDPLFRKLFAAPRQ